MLAAEAWADEILPEERLRVHQYQVLARFLAAPPDAGLLDLASRFEADESEFGRALADLALRAGQMTPEAASHEYHALFIGIGRGELVPYASYYLTGFLNEMPLAKLRRDMARLGIARAETVKEPEDHIAALCEMMAGLITGAFGRRSTSPPNKRSSTGIWRHGRQCFSQIWRRRGRRGSMSRSERLVGCSWVSRRPPS